jgi:hypothetical protein
LGSNVNECLCWGLQIQRDCGFFEWVDPPLCEHGKRVVSRLRQRHESLLAEAKRCETMVEVEVGKVRAEMEKEALQMKAGLENDIALYRMEINIGEIKLQAMKKNYQSIIVCSWIFCAMCLFLFAYTSKCPLNGEVGRMALP